MIISPSTRHHVLVSTLLIGVSAFYTHPIYANSAAADVPTIHPQIVGGALAESPKTTVALCEGDSFYNCLVTCGGTLVSPNLIATSRHCADVVQIDSLDCATYRFSGTSKPANRLWVTVASPVSNDASFHQGLRWDFPKPIGCGHDLAFLTLIDEIPADQSPPQAPATSHDSVTSIGGDALTIYGYGRTAPDAPLDPQRRSIQAKVLCIGGRDTCKTIAGGDLFDTEFAVDAEVCPGDSGSGAFAPNGLLLGTLARSIGGTNTCAYGVYTRLAPHGLLLARTATTAAALGSYPTPSWVDDLNRAGDSPSIAPKDFGAPCDDDADCNGGLCRSYDGGLAYTCVRRCADGCSAACRHLDDGDYCFDDPTPPVDHSCAMSPNTSSTTPASTRGVYISLAFLLYAVSRRARRA